MESCPTQAVLPLVGLAAEQVIRDRYINAPRRVALSAGALSAGALSAGALSAGALSAGALSVGLGAARGTASPLLLSRRHISHCVKDP
ncbi:MAG: hypothetical protein ACQESR_05955 [Planctomycetota bacterium]